MISSQILSTILQYQTHLMVIKGKVVVTDVKPHLIMIITLIQKIRIAYKDYVIKIKMDLNYIGFTLIIHV